MSGIDRLRALAGAWDEWGLGGALADIADQIERERDAEVADSPYDAILPEDRDAVAWVREHGGIDDLTRMFQDADNRRVELCGALGIDLDKGWSEAMAAMRLRLMPEGCEWPRYESGDLVMFGDCVENRNGTCTVNSVRFYSGGGVTVYGEGRGAQFVVVTEPVMRDPIRKANPKVLAADGEPLEVGQTVWADFIGDKHCRVVRVSGENSVCIRDYDGDGEYTELMCNASDLTHQCPVLDADGVPIKVGDTVYEVGENYPPFIVGRLPEPGAYRSVMVVYPSGAFTSLDPERLTHAKPEPPDSAERIAEDIKRMAEEWCSYPTLGEASEKAASSVGEATMGIALSNLAKRCRALAERERGE